MKTVFGLFAFIGFALAGQVHAYALDTKMCEGDVTSGQSFETAAMQTCVNTYFAANALGTAPTIVWDDRWNQGDAGFNIQQDSVSGQWYINVNPQQPGFFSLKFGTGSFEPISDTYFFMNIGEMTKLVFNQTQVNNLIGGCGANNCNSGRLSHYSIFNDEGGKVPEPASLALLGAGLAGLALVRRRRRG